MRRARGVIGDRNGKREMRLQFLTPFSFILGMRERRRKQVAVIHNELARARTELTALGYRLVIMLAVKATQEGDLVTHRLRVKDYMAGLGLAGRSAYETLERAADEMMRSLVEINNPVDGSRTKFQIFSYAKYWDHQGIIELRFHDEMRPLLVQLKEHFTQVPLDVFLRLKSSYAMRMYMYVRSWNPRDARNQLPAWEFTLERARSFLALKGSAYDEPKHIAVVLKRAMRELNERADVTFRYDPIKEGKRVVGWSFRAIPNTPTMTLPSGAAAAKRREELHEQEQAAKLSRSSAARLEGARKRWEDADDEQRRSWLAQFPGAWRLPSDPTRPGAILLSNLAELLERDQNPSLPGIITL
jgi:plasmid replication initiation protein